MNEMGARIAEKGGRREEKRLRMTVYEREFVICKTGC